MNTWQDWSVPKVWAGETVFILGGGPSLASQGTERLRGRRCIALNSSYIRHPFCDYIFSGDQRWLNNPPTKKVISGKIWHGRVVTYSRSVNWPGLLHLKLLAPPDGKHPGRPVLTNKPIAVCGRHTSFHGAINFALHLTGAFDQNIPRPRLVLLGADGGRNDKGESSHHAAHPWPHKDHTWGEQLFDLEMVVKPLADLGVEVLNASPGTHWPDLWPVTTLDAVLAGEPANVVRGAIPKPIRKEPPAISDVPISYAVAAERSSPLFAAAWAAGCGGRVEPDGLLAPGPVALFGSPRRWNLLNQARAEGRDWFYADHAYFGRFKYYRITRNAYQHDGKTGPGSAARFAAHGIDIKPWRKSGDHVLVCPPDAKFAGLFNFDAGAWIAHVTAALTALTPRPIRIRDRACADLGPLGNDLAEAWCLVTYVSNAAVEALCAGVPAIVTGACAARPLAATDLRAIVEPPTPSGRAAWAAVLAANQWTFDEVRAGMTARHFGLIHDQAEGKKVA